MLTEGEMELPMFILNSLHFNKKHLKIEIHL